MIKLNLTIRERLSLLYTMVLLCLIIAFCAILYSSISISLNNKTKSELLRYAHKLSESYDAERKIFKDFPDGDFNENPLYWFRIITPEGSYYRPAPSFSIMTNARPLKDIVRYNQDKPYFYEFSQANQRFSSIIYPIREGFEFTGWVEVVISVTDDKQMLFRILFLIVLSGIVIISLLFFAGRFLAGKTLKPVEEIRKQVDSIYGKNLSSRIVTQNSEDELGQLAKTFNQMLDRVENTFEKQRQFIADASHELKTPVAILRSQLEKMAMQDNLDRETQKKIITDIEELANISRIISSLLLLSTPENKIIGTDSGVVSLNELFSALKEDVNILAEAKQQIVQITVQENLSLAGDKTKLYQLFLNLADNAIKYTPEKGSLKIDVSKSSNQIVITFEDSGIGIPSEHLPFVFERFYRVDKSRSRKTGGHGLGLAVCKAIVEAHKGNISIQSTEEIGTLVTVVIPA